MSNKNETTVSKARAFLEQEHVPMDFSGARHYLCCRLTGYAREKGVKLGETLHTRYLDLALVPYLEHFDQDGSLWLPELPKEAAAIWQVTTDEIVREALANTQAVYPPRMQTLMDLMAFRDQPLKDTEDAGLYILTAGEPRPDYVTGNSFGAVALVLPGVLEKAADRFQSDFYVLPRSMADVLLLPIKDGNDPGLRCMKEIMAASNEMTENAPILSDNVYRYVRGDGLMIV
ncbi:MAG: DUF5688 family protein [Bhargavaea sp.]